MTSQEFGAWRRRQRQQARVALLGSVYIIGKFRQFLALATLQPVPILSTEYFSEPNSQERSNRAMWGE
jgi:hypothetical protein